MRVAPRIWRTGLVAVVFGLGALAACGTAARTNPQTAATATPRTYALFGAGEKQLRSGMLAAEGNITAQPIGLAVRSDGVVAFATEGAVYWVQDGRLLRLRVPIRGSWNVDLAFAANGKLLVAMCDDSDGNPAAAVFSAAPGSPAELVAGQPTRTGSSGDGGPATAARLQCADGVAADSAGGVLIADSRARRVRRVDPSGLIQTVAGSGRSGVSGDGGPASQASLGMPVDVAPLPGGGFAIADRGGNQAQFESTSGRGIRIVDTAGTITTRAPVDATSIATTADGSLLLANWTDRMPRVRRLLLDGRVIAAVDLRTGRLGIPTFIPVAGDPFRSDKVQVDGAVPTPDGGMLVAADFAIQYVAPAHPSVLALALRPATRHPRPRLTVHLTTTRPARVTVEAWWHGHRAATATANVAGGDGVLPVRTRLRSGAYDVRVTARGDGQVAAARATVLVGGLLPVSYAENFVESRLELFTTFDDALPATAQCRRVSRRRVDCVIVQRNRCAGVATVRILPDGTLGVAAQAGGRRSCPRRP